MGLKLKRSRLAVNTAGGKENMATKFQGKVPVNVYFGLSDSGKDPELGPEYMGYLAKAIRIQKENM